MKDVKIATDKAVKYLKTFFPNANRIQLEEIELAEAKDFWLITLSFENIDSSNNWGVVVNERRSYKIFKIDTTSGDVISMKIRDSK